MNLKNSGDSTGFEPMTSAMPVQCSNQLSYEVTQWRAGQFVESPEFFRFMRQLLKLSSKFVSELGKLKGSTAINEAKLKCGLCCKSYSVPLDRKTAGKVSFFKTSKYFRDNTT